MKRDNLNYTLVGLFVTTMLCALLVALLLLTGRDKTTDGYYADFANTAGIKAGTPVTYEGYEIGRVEMITPMQKDGKTSYRVALQLQAGWVIPQDSYALKISTGMLSPLVVEIKEGQSRQRLALGGRVATRETANMFEAITLLASQLAEVTEVGIKPLVANIAGRVDRLGGELDKTLPGTLQDMSAMLARANSASRQLERLLSEQNQKHLTGMLRNGDLTAEHLASLTRDLSGTRHKLEKLMDETQALVGDSRPDIAEALTEMRQSLKRINTVLHQFENTGRNMAEFSRTIRENPSALITSTPPKDNAEKTK